MTDSWDRMEREKLSVCLAQPGTLSLDVLVELPRKDWRSYLEKALKVGWSPRRVLELQLEGGVVKETDVTHRLKGMPNAFSWYSGWSRIAADDAAGLAAAWQRSNDMTLRLLAQQLSGGALDVYPKKEYNMLVCKAPRRRLAAEPSARYIQSEMRIAVWQHDGGRCARCGAIEELEFDYIIPVAKGGSSTVNNIELLCRACNRQKSDRII